MKKFIRIFVPILLAIAVVLSIGWYLIKYDPGFTRDMLLKQARLSEERGNHSIATWFYNLAYKQSGEDEEVAVELAEQFKSMGNYTKAEYTLSNAIADGATAGLYTALCKTYVDQDKLLDAVTMLDNIADPAIKEQLSALRPSAPTATPEQGYYNQYITVTLESNGGKIYTSTDGQYPSSKNAPYTDPITLPGGETTIYALAIGDNGLVSPLSIVGYTVAGVIEEVTLSDPTMDQLVRQQLQVTDSHTLYTNELWSITALEIPADVKNLSDLALMPFLEKLTIPAGSYENLASVSGLTSLKELKIDGVALSAEELKAIGALPNLTSLSLAGCSISSISDLTAATGLTYLDLNNNTIRDLSVLSSLSNLEYLNLSHNAVTTLDALSGLTKLANLDLSYNSITSTAPLSGCTGLTTLNLSYNSLKTLEGIDKLAALSSLNAVFNKLTDVNNLAANTALIDLNIANNAITDITALSTLTKLTNLNFSYNQVTKLPALPTDCALVTVNGANNQLTSVEELKGLQHLNYVIMDNNAGITTIAPLVNCTHLVEVSVYGTGVTNATALTDMNVIVKYAPV